jgi:hypothetical protein
MNATASKLTEVQVYWADSASGHEGWRERYTVDGEQTDRPCSLSDPVEPDDLRQRVADLIARHGGPRNPRIVLDSDLCAHWFAD